MANQIEERIDKIKNNFIGYRRNFKYTNTVAINGWLLNKPDIRIIDVPHNTAKEMAIFMLFQITSTGVRRILCKTYGVKAIEQLKKVECCSLINCLGFIEYSPLNHLCITMYEIAVSVEFVEMPLCEKFVRKPGYGRKKFR